MLTRLRLSIRSLTINDPRFDSLDTVLCLRVKAGPYTLYRFIDLFMPRLASVDSTVTDEDEDELWAAQFLNKDEKDLLGFSDLITPSHRNEKQEQEEEEEEEEEKDKVKKKDREKDKEKESDQEDWEQIADRRGYEGSEALPPPLLETGFSQGREDEEEARSQARAVELEIHELSFELDLEQQDLESPLKLTLSGWDPGEQREITIDWAEAALSPFEKIQPVWTEGLASMEIEARWIPYREDVSEKVLPINVADVSTPSSLKLESPSDLKIVAQVPSSQPLTLRRGPMRVMNEWHDLFFESALTSESKDHFDPADFQPPKALVLVSSPGGWIDLIATSELDLGPIDWHVVRCADDSPAARELGTKPQVEPRGATRGRLRLDACGSFYVAALRRGSSRAAVLPLVLVSCAVASKTIATGGELPPEARFTSHSREEDVDEDPERVRLSTGDENRPAVGLDASVRLLGGGKDGKRGVDRVYLGWANNLRSETFNCFYGMGVWMKVGIAFTIGGNLLPFRQTQRDEKQDWIVIEGPVLDTDRYSLFRKEPSHSRHGGHNVLLKSARSEELPQEDPGALLQVQAEDIPSKWAPVHHPFTPKLLIEEIYWQFRMRAALLVWTDTEPGVRQPPLGLPGRVGFRTFHTLALVNWGMEGRWYVDPPQEGHERFVLVSSSKTPPRHDLIGQEIFDRPMPPADAGFEVRPPTILENILLDYTSGWTQEADEIS